MVDKILKVLVIIDAVVLNLGMGFAIYKVLTMNVPAPVTQLEKPIAQTQLDVCGVECQKYIDIKVNALNLTLASTPGVTVAPTTKPVNSTKVVPRTKTRNTSYVTIPGAGSTNINTWQDISGTDFYFDKADYPGLVEIYFETNMKLFNGNGMAYVRLYDVSHGIGVQGGDVSTNSQLDTLVTSGKINFWAGKNLIRIQVKSLTADTAIYNYGRLKVVTEN